MQELVSCPSKSKGNAQESLPSNVEQPETCKCVMFCIKAIITFDITGGFVRCFVLVGDNLFFQPNIEFAAKLDIFFSHDPDPLHKPSITVPSNISKTGAQFKLGCPAAVGVQALLKNNF